MDTIGEGAFCGCINMADEDGFLIVRNVLYDYFGEAENVIVPSFVTSISYGAFMDCDYIRSVVIPESVEHISPSAFCGCTGLADEDGFVIIRDVLYNYSGKNDVIIIPPGVVSISDWAFSPNQGVYSYKQSSSQY